jgi:SPW repeat
MKRPPIPHIYDRRPLAAGAVILWIAISPWVWGFADSHSAVANHVSLVFGFGPLALLIANLRAAAFVTLLGGVWLAISPWVLDYAGDHAAWLNELVAGLLLIVLCASAAGVPIPRRGGTRLARRKSAGPGIAKTAGSRG